MYEQLKPKNHNVKEPVHFKDFRIALDSGAHTLYTQIFVGVDNAKGKQMKKLSQADYSYMESDGFKSYLEDYIQFLLEHGDKYDFYVTLDIIGDAEKSWEVTEYIESFGLKPLPVYHWGETTYWLEKMVEKYDYVGIGGLGQEVSKEKFIPFADNAFKVVCDKYGHPKVKTHGFAVASPELIAKYPWHTCDASTWTALSRNGTVYIPKPIMKGKEVIDFNYLTPPMSLPVTVRRSNHTNHMDHKSPLYSDLLEKYFGQYGYTFEDVKRRYDARDVLNIKFFKQMEAAAKEVLEKNNGYGEGANIILAGTPSGASTNLSRFVDLLGEINEPETYWFGSYYYKRHNQNLMDLQEKHLAGEDARLLQLLPRRRRNVTVIEPTELVHDEFPFTRKVPEQSKVAVTGSPTSKITDREVPTDKPIQRRKLSVKPRSLTNHDSDTSAWPDALEEPKKNKHITEAAKTVNTLREALSISSFGAAHLTDEQIEIEVQRSMIKIINSIKYMVCKNTKAFATTEVSINVNGKIYE